ncbi:hypothetical protein E0L36_14945 [Streptomyces sp. AJS327]|uniref:DUF6278 family protein n=1 Tax=Streptomyces sp. AJS327 TaxID=2545265 RepID=UPI0015DF0F17|nr:DUF6278 family protein [Streptomyces sp. AJS327]MBA0052149.1 hypothetical protein [Streptomyces sp. AJS327]
MDIPFLDTWRKRRESVVGDGEPGAEPGGPAGAEQLLSECELLRERAGVAGVRLDDTPESLAALDQLLPDWRDDPEVAPWLGTDAGLYLGTVLVRTVPGASWRLREKPLVRLASGRELDVLEAGATWAATGTPELSQLYGEASEG